MTQEVIPLMLGSSGLGWATREMGAAFMMGGVSYLPWLAGSLEELSGEGYVGVHDGGRRPKWIDVINTNIYYRKIPTVT